jgi:hypothetical protein
MRQAYTARAMSEDAVITHAEALRLIDEQVGERVYLALFVTRAESESGEEGLIPFIHMTGRLGNALAPGPPRLEPDVGYYGFGREAFDAFPFPPLVGETRLRDNGIDFLVSDTVWIRIAWRGSKEVGDSHPRRRRTEAVEGDGCRRRSVEGRPLPETFPRQGRARTR